MLAAGFAPMLSAFESMCDSTPVFSHPHSQPQLCAGRCIAESLTIRAASKKSGDPDELVSCIVNDSTGAHMRCSMHTIREWPRAPEPKLRLQRLQSSYIDLKARMKTLLAVTSLISILLLPLSAAPAPDFAAAREE